MGEVSLLDMQSLAPENQTLPGIPKSMSLDDMQKVSPSSEIQYTPPKPEVPIGERIAQDIEKPFAEVPHTIGSGLYWLGSNMGTGKEGLGDRMARAGIVMRERNEAYMKENFSNFKPGMIDDIISGASSVVPYAGAAAIAGLIGIPAAATAGGIATVIGGSVAAESFAGFKAQGKSTAKADALALAIGVPVGGVMALGFGHFLDSTGPWFQKMITGSLTGMAAGAGQSAVAGSMQLATGLVPYEGKESLVKVMSQAVHDGVVWGVLGGATAIPLALTNHNAVVKGFKELGFSDKEAMAKTEDIMSQTSHVAMDQIEKDAKYTPAEKDRIQIQFKKELPDSKPRPDVLDRDFIPEDLKTPKPEVVELNNKVERLKLVQKDIEDISGLLEKTNKEISDTKVVPEAEFPTLKNTEDAYTFLKKNDFDPSVVEGLKLQEAKLSRDIEKLGGYEAEGEAFDKVANLITQKGYIHEALEALPAEEGGTKSPVKRAAIEKATAEFEKRKQVGEEALRKLTDLKKDAELYKSQIAELKEKLKPKTTPLSETRMQIQKLKQGFRQGRSETREEIGKVQSQMANLVRSSELEAADKSKFLTALKNTQTVDQLRKTLPEIENKIRRLHELALEKKWAGDLKKVAERTVDRLPVDYQDALKPVLDSFDFGRKSKTELIRSAKTIEFFKNKLSAEEPLSPDEQNALDVAAKKSLSEMTHEEIQNVHDTIMKVVHQGLMKDKYLTNLEKRNHEQRVAQFLEDINGDDFKEQVDNFDRNSLERNRPVIQRINDIARKINDTLTSPEYMMKWSGMSDVFQVLHEGFQKKIEYKQQYMRDIEKIFKDIDFKKVLSKSVEVPELGLTGDKAPRVDDMMRVYAQSFDEGGRRHLESTMAPDKLDALLGHFEREYPDEAKAVMKMFDYFREVVGPQVDEMSVKMNGHHIQFRDFYDPIGSSLEDRSGLEMKNELELGSKGMERRALPLSGFTKSRVKSELAFRKFDYFGNLMRHFGDVANYRAMAEPIRDANKVIYDPRVMKALRDKFGSEWVSMLQKTLKDTAFDGHQYDSFTARLSGYIRQNFILAKLMFNPLSAGKVYAQMGPAATYVGPGWISKASVDYSMNRKALDAFIDSKSLQMKNRYFMQERELADRIQQQGPSSLGLPKGNPFLIKLGMAMHQETDKEVTRVTWLGEYRKQMAMNDVIGGTENDAIAKADMAVRLTHPQGGTLYLPDAFRGNEFQKGITTFLNVPNRNFNLLRDATRQVKSGEMSPINYAANLAGIGLIPAIIMAGLSFRRAPNTKEVFEETVNQIIGSELYLGFLIRAMIFKTDVSPTIPILEPLKDIHNIIRRKDKKRYALSLMDDLYPTGTSNVYRMLSGQMFKPVKEK